MAEQEGYPDQVILRESYPEGVPCWVDSGRVDSTAARDFYGGLFGWEFENISPPGAAAYFVGRIDGKDVAAIGEQEQQLDLPVWNTYVLVEDADEAAANAVKAGGSVQLPPMDAGPAGRFAGLADPEGASFCVWRMNEFRGGQLVNVPGAWNFSDLHPRSEEGDGVLRPDVRLDRGRGRGRGLRDDLPARLRRAPREERSCPTPSASRGSAPSGRSPT